jgi:hypothetical protein
MPALAFQQDFGARQVALEGLAVLDFAIVV